MNEQPLVSVVIPVFNGQETVKQAIESILAQSFTNFEVIVINDGSTDNTYSVVRAFGDTRVSVISQVNQGAGAARKKGVEKARGKYIAVQDADDISFPTRLAVQVKFLEDHPRCVAVGTWSRIQGTDNSFRKGHEHPTSNGELQLLMLFDAYFVASSVMIRKSELLNAGNYEPLTNGLEDFELWSRLKDQGDIANVPQVLVTYREMPGSLSRSNLVERNREAVAISAANICRARGHRTHVKCEMSRGLATAVRHSGQEAVSFSQCIPMVSTVLILSIQESVRNPRQVRKILSIAFMFFRSIGRSFKAGRANH